MDRRRRYARRLRHAARAPVRGVCGLCFERLCDNLLDPVIADLAWRTASRLVVDAIKAMLCEPIAPRPDGLARDAHYTCDLAVVQPIGRAQNDLGPLRIGARDLAASDTSVEHSPLIGAQFDPARLSICHHRLQSLIGSIKSCRRTGG